MRKNTTPSNAVVVSGTGTTALLSQLPKMDPRIPQPGPQIPRANAKALIDCNPRQVSLVFVHMVIRFISNTSGAEFWLLFGALTDAIRLAEIYIESLLKESLLKENRKIYVVCGEKARITRQIDETIVSIAFDVVPNEENPMGFSGLTMVISFDNAMKMGSEVKFQCFLGKPKSKF
jgi:hypothetical protein